MSHEKPEAASSLTLSPRGGGPAEGRGRGATRQRHKIHCLSTFHLLPSTFLLCILLLPTTHAQTAAPALTPTQQQQVQRVGEGLRCPICRDTLPITESGNDISKGMLREIGVQVAAGKSDEEIYRFFTDRYGERIRLNPERSGSNLLLWGLPLLALLGGGAWLAGYLRGKPASTTPATDEPEDPYLAEIRARVGRERQQ